MAHQVNSEHDGDGVDRRGFLKCMAWAGTGLVWTVSGGILSSRVFGAGADRSRAGSFSFVQISDSHIGFAKEANKNVVGTLQATVDKINALPTRPELLIHTGDLTHLSTPREFDTVAEILKGAKVGHVAYVPGEHDVIGNSQYLERFGKETRGEGWYSFKHRGVHFIGLVNVAARGHRPGARDSWHGATRLAQGRPGGALRQYAGRRVRPCPARGGLSPMGLGHPGRSTGRWDI